jgi:hypothetical protein
MDLGTWQESIGAVADHIGSYDALEARIALRAALIRVHRHMLLLPSPHDDAPRTIARSELRDAQQDLSSIFDSGGRFARLAEILAEQPDIVTLFAATRLLDEALASAPRNWRDSAALDGQSAERWRCTITGDFCIPAIVAPGTEPARIIVGDRFGRSYHKRSVRNHRILPGRIGDFTVQPVDLSGMLFCKETGEARVASALFTDFRAVPMHAPPTDRFILVDASFAGGDDTLAKQIDVATAENCSALMWPELAITSASLATIAATIARHADALATTPSLTIGGSWHYNKPQAGPDAVVNRCIVLDGRGKVLAMHDKFYPFLHESRNPAGSFGVEAITPGTVLPVLVMGDICAAIGICLDFCHLGQPIPYLELNVDLMLVPSLGQQSTIDSHIGNARTMQSRFGTQSFIVQQRLPDPAVSAENLGWHIAGPPSDRSNSATIQKNDCIIDEIFFLRGATGHDNEAL